MSTRSSQEFPGFRRGNLIQIEARLANIFRWTASRTPMKRLSPFILAGSMLATLLPAPAMAAQPYMQGALQALQNARASLQTAAADKGGHRERAIQLIDEAIRHVKVGMAVAR
jgi:hypothetical protein